MHLLHNGCLLNFQVISPWIAYKDIEKRNGISLKLEKLYADTFAHKKTDDTAMQIDSESPVDPVQLQQLIDKKVDKQVAFATKKLSAEVN